MTDERKMTDERGNVLSDGMTGGETDDVKNGEGKVSSKAFRLEELRRKWFRRDNLIIIILAGILLFIIALPTKKEEDTGGSLFANPVSKLDSPGVFAPEGAESAGQNNVLNAGNKDALTDYAEAQEKKLAELLSAINGVGKVEVMLTFLSSEELVVEKDAPTVRSNTIEKDSEGGSRTVTQFEMGDSTVYRSSSGTSEPYVVKTLNPRVEGVLVVAEGAGDDAVSGSIAQIAQALFGVEAHKVVVMPMESGTGSVTVRSGSAGSAGNATVRGGVSVNVGN